MTKAKKRENPLIKIYLLILFFCGIGLWFAVSGAPKEKVSVDIELEKKIVDILSSSGIKQTDIMYQYTRERETTARQWSEFYKKIQLRGEKRSGDFEKSFRALARSMNLGLSKTDNVDASVTYKFYSSGMTYSNITFVNPRKTISSSSKKAKESVPSKNKNTNNSKVKK